MKQRYAVVLLFVLIVASGFTSYWSYAATEQRVTADMRQALCEALDRQQSDVITPDTIRTFNSYLHMEQLRGRATLAVSASLGDKQDGRRFRCYAQCSPATILALSDQRPALVLWTTALLWAAFCWYRRRASVAVATALAVDDGRQHYGGLSYSAADGRFFAASGEAVQFTPMQQQLMELFFRAPLHRLTKQEICNALWPKKDDASETLYTLIRRLKPVVERYSRLHITSDRSRAYELSDKCQ